MVLHPTTESKSKLENCGVGVQRSMGTKKVEGPWHGHHGQLLKENYDPLKFEDFWGLGSNSWCAPHTPSSVPPPICVTGRDTSRLICGSQGLRRWSQLCKDFWSQLSQNIVGQNCARISLETIVSLGPRPQPCGCTRVRKGCPTDGGLPDGGGRLEDVEVLQDVWNRHQTQCS